MKINEFCNMSELSSILKNWAALTCLNVNVLDTDGKLIASSAEIDEPTDDSISSEPDEAFDAGDPSYSRAVNIDIKLDEEVIGKISVTEQQGNNKTDLSVALPLLDQLINNYVSNHYYTYANEKVLSHLSDGIALL